MCKLFILFSLLVLSCNPLYVLESAYQGSKILIKREKITKLIKDKKGDNKDLINKFEHIINTKIFAKANSLNSDNAFNYFTKLDKEVLSWIVMASKKDKFELITWWFPVVGSVPYKGFFKKEDATDYAKELETEGFETSVRPTSAYSTLGWFDDPITSPLLNKSVPQIVNTIFHELVHKSVWIKGHVDFNESLATFIGDQLAIDYFKAIKNLDYLNYSIKTKEHDLFLSKILSNLNVSLNKLYNSNIIKEEKLIKRKEIFNKIISKYRENYPESRNFKKLNNAEIMQSFIYLKETSKFNRIYKKLNSEMKDFLKFIKEIEVKCSDTCKPFNLIDKASKVS